MSEELEWKKLTAVAVAVTVPVGLVTRVVAVVVAAVA